MKSVAAFRKALIAALKANSGVSAIVQQRVFDQVPPTTTTSPWLFIGSIVATQEPGSCGAQWNVQIRLYAVQTTYKADPAWDLLVAARDAVEGAILTLPDGMAQTLAIEVVSVGDVFDPQQPLNTFLDLTAMVAG